jgi:uncharacterized protein YoxC
MSAGEIAGLVAAFAFVLLVGMLAVPLLKLGKVLDQTTELVKGVTDETIPLLNEVTTTVTTTNESLVRVEAISGNVEAISGNVGTVSANVSGMSSLMTIAFGVPMIKVMSISYGVRQAWQSRRDTTGGTAGRGGRRRASP